jgi:hypothetical protein
VCTDDAFFFLNIKNFLATTRKGVRELYRPKQWWQWAMRRAGWEQVRQKKVPANGLRDGANSEARLDCEWVVVFRKT